MQDLVKQTIREHGGLWSRDEILLKLIEELGELVQAFRKKTLFDQAEEFGDVLFGLFCLAEVVGFDTQKIIETTCKKHIKNVKNGLVNYNDVL